MSDAIRMQTILFVGIAEGDGLSRELRAEALNPGGSPRVS